jgi:hypothetical protein
MRDAAAGVIGDAGAAGVEVFVFMSVLSEKYVPKAARRYPPSGTDFDHDTAPNDFRDFSGCGCSPPVVKVKKIKDPEVRARRDAASGCSAVSGV